MSLARAEEIGRNAVASDPDATFTEYKDEEAVALMALINDQEPKTDWPADVVIVIDHKEIFERVALSEHGCVTKAFRVPREAWEAIVGKAKDAAGRKL